MKLTRMLVLLIAVMVFSVPCMAKEYSSTFTWYIGALDSSAARETQTDSLNGAQTLGTWSTAAATKATTPATTGAPIFYFSGLGDMNQVKAGTWSGIAELYILKRDSDDAAAQIADTTRDTVIVSWYTAYNSLLTANSTGYARAGETLIKTDTFTTAGTAVAGAQTKALIMPSGTSIGDAVYARIQAIYRAPNKTDTVAIKYKMAVRMIVR